MSGKHGDIILFYLLNNGSITWMEHEDTSLSLHEFLYAVARLVFNRLVITDQVERVNKGGDTLIVNRYKLSQSGQHFASKLQGRL